MGADRPPQPEPSDVPPRPLRFLQIPLLVLPLVLSLALWAAAGPAFAQTETPQRPFGKLVEEWNQELDQIAQELGKQELPQPRVETLRDHLASIVAEAQKAQKDAQEQLKPLNTQLEALGEPPAEGKGPEVPEIAAQRKKLNDDIAFYKGRIAQAELAIARAGELRDKLTAQTLERTVQRLLRSYPYPLAPDTVAAAVPNFLNNLRQITASPVVWWNSLTPQQRGLKLFGRLALALGLALVIGWAARRALLHWFGRDPRVTEPSYARRLAGAIADGLAYGIVPSLILAAFLYRALSDQSLISGLFANVFATTCGVLILFTLATALPRALLAPAFPAWRLLPITSDHARLISWWVSFLAAAFAVDLFFQISGRWLEVSSELESLHVLVAKSIEAVAILALMHGRLWEGPEGAPAGAQAGAPSPLGVPFWPTLRRLIGAVAVAAVLAALMGYAALSRYLIDNLVISAMAIGALALARGLVRELIGVALRSKVAYDMLGLPHKTRSRYKVVLRIVFDLVVYLGGFVVLLLVWGVSSSDIATWLGELTGRFKIGNVTFSLPDILVGVLVFFVVVTLTRTAQRVLNERVFPNTRLDSGVRHSLSVGVRYAGLAIAILLAIAAVGIDLSNIALIAGALSVGIGFGLQNIVNNFVSGLILLVERPVKVGDWIVVGSYEGYVKRINVRATEIQTFQRASIIVPNSEIISGAVTNWTYKDSYGRAEVRVGVAYGSDVDRVMAILRDVLQGHKEILDDPKPYVLFKGFGDSSLDFEARGYIGDVAWRIFIESELRVAINRALAEAGIEIPFPQRDLHIKSVAEGARTFMAGTAAPPEAGSRRAGTDRTAQRPPAEREDPDGDG